MTQYGQSYPQGPREPIGPYGPRTGGPSHYPHEYPQRRRGLPWWGWLIIGIVLFFILSCGGLFAFFAYVGSKGPDIKAYTVHELPQEYLTMVQNLGLLEHGEEIRFFYSDALMDIRDGLYFVSDRRVVIYRHDAAKPTTTVRFDDIADAELQRDTSFFNDSTITLTLKNGEVIFFPVSSELDRDEHFFNAIKAPKSSRQPPQQQE